VKQSHNYDCGLACVEMILKGHGREDVGLSQLEKLHNTHQIWTIHLVDILNHYNVQYAFTTVIMGVDPSHEEEEFYSIDFREGVGGVPKLFEKAKREKWACQERSVQSEEIFAFVSDVGPVIALINSRILQCKVCGDFSRCRFAIPGENGKRRTFEGHYVVLLHYDKKFDILHYRDPGVPKHSLCITSAANFEAAWKSRGTDEDLIWIPQRADLFESTR